MTCQKWLHVSAFSLVNVGSPLMGQREPELRKNVDEATGAGGGAWGPPPCPGAGSTVFVNTKPFEAEGIRSSEPGVLSPSLRSVSGRLLPSVLFPADARQLPGARLFLWRTQRSPWGRACHRGSSARHGRSDLRPRRAPRLLFPGTFFSFPPFFSTAHFS